MLSRLRNLAGTILFFLVLAAPATAQSVAYKPPAVGTTIVYDAGYTSKVTAVEDDVVTVEISAKGTVQEVKFYKSLTSLEVGPLSLTIDTAAADRLWPLVPGKTAAIPISGTDSGTGATLQGTQTVTVVGFEEVDLGFAKFDTAVLDVDTEMTLTGMMDQQGQPLQPQAIQFTNKRWYVYELGVDAKSDLTMTVNGQAQPPASATATEINVP